MDGREATLIRQSNGTYTLVLPIQTVSTVVFTGHLSGLTIGDIPYDGEVTGSFDDNTAVLTIRNLPSSVLDGQQCQPLPAGDLCHRDGRGPARRDHQNRPDVHRRAVNASPARKRLRGSSPAAAFFCPVRSGRSGSLAIWSRRPTACSAPLAILRAAPAYAPGVLMDLRPSRPRPPLRPLPPGPTACRRQISPVVLSSRCPPFSSRPAAAKAAAVVHPGSGKASPTRFLVSPRGAGISNLSNKGGLPFVPTF